MYRAMQGAIDAQLDAAFRRIRTRTFDRLVGTSGLIGNLTEIIALRRTGRPLPQLNLATVSLREVQTVERLLREAPLKARLAIPGLDPKRADTLLPATAVVRTLMERTGQERMTISDKAIREGLLYDFIERNREGITAEQEILNVRRRAVLRLAEACRYPKTHSHHVARLALQLFDQTRPVHGQGECEREWLEYAALLHDVGYLINARQHHKHAYYLIKHSDLDGLAAEEIEMIASIARYHRRALPRDAHEQTQRLSPRRRRVLEVLSALLRIADGLDRSHFSVIQGLRVSLGNPVTIVLQTAGDPELEIWAARIRADLFEQVFKRPIQFAARRTYGEPA